MKYAEKYEYFESLLLYFLIWGEEIEPPLDDLSIIKKYVHDLNKDLLEEIITQGREILELEPFPDDWIADISNRYFPAGEFPTYKAWIKWVVDTLEIEAKNAGKL